MASFPMSAKGVTLEEFLRMPDIEEAPYLEYIDGRIEAKAMPSRAHTLISKGFDRRFDDFCEAELLGVSGQEIRYTFAGRSILPDVSFQLMDKVEIDPNGIPANRINIA